MKRAQLTPSTIIKFSAFLLLLFSQLTIWGCKKSRPSDQLLFDTVPVAVPVLPILKEVSGIADSRVNKGYLWAQEDGNNPARLNILNHDGTVVKNIFLKSITNRDWEDMAFAGGDIYLADIGDNFKRYSTYTIYRFAEPSMTVDTVTAIEAIRFQYPDGPRNAEAILVDRTTKDIYIITKEDAATPIFKIAYPYQAGTVNMAVQVGTLNYGGVVSAALAPDGKQVIVKTYSNLFLYSGKEGEKIENILQKNRTVLPYKMEPQGEAVTFSLDNKGYFTLSEAGFFNKVNLFYYKRK